MKLSKAKKLRAAIAAFLISGGVCGLSMAGTAEASPMIGEIQGAGHYSPYEGKEVEDIQGVVTFVEGSKVFYIQDAGDGDQKTSDGIMVYLPDHGVAPGDLVSVSGVVKEYFGRGYKGKEETDLPITEISGDSVKKLGTADIPAPVVLDKDRKIPRTNIDNDGMKSFDPEEDALDFWESLEGMRVAVENPRLLGPQMYGEVYVVPKTHEGPFNNSGGLTITPGELHPEHICLQILNEKGWGDKTFIAKASDRFDGTVAGVVTYGFGAYKVATHRSDLPTFVDGGLAPEKTTILPDPNKLLIASYNIENFSGNAKQTPDSKVARLSESIVNDLKLPDIITVLELQDNDGPEDSGDSDASKSAQRLIDGIQKVSGVTYRFVNINPVDNEDGGQPGSNIRVAYFYNPNRVTLKEGPIGKPNDENRWKDGHLALNPGRIDPENENYIAVRKSLAAEFTFQGKDIVIIANHLNSKRSDDRPYGQKQPPVLHSEKKRVALADMLAKFVAEGQKQNPDLNIVLTGDFNDFEFSEPIRRLEAAGLTNLVKEHELSDRYAYFFMGNNQTLDNILISNKLASKASFDMVHVNAPFMEEHGRVSDHDPLVVQLDLR